jgi:hypothetical protein
MTHVSVDGHDSAGVQAGAVKDDEGAAKAEEITARAETAAKIIFVRSVVGRKEEEIFLICKKSAGKID